MRSKDAAVEYFVHVKLIFVIKCIVLNVVQYNHWICLKAG